MDRNPDPLVDGSQRSLTAKSRIIINPAQYTGMDCPISATAIPIRSHRVPGRVDEKIPMGTAALLWYGGSRVLADADRVRDGLITASQALTIGDLVVFLAYLTALLGPIATLAQSATALQNNLAGLDRTLDLLAEPIEMPPGAGAIRVVKSRIAGRITLRDVDFSYPGKDRSVLCDINLDVPAGQTVALVGASGAGKTTLCNLIARFYDPQRGSIELDGTDLRDLHVESYRQLLCERAPEQFDLTRINLLTQAHDFQGGHGQRPHARRELQQFVAFLANVVQRLQRRSG